MENIVQGKTFQKGGVVSSIWYFWGIQLNKELKCLYDFITKWQFSYLESSRKVVARLPVIKTPFLALIFTKWCGNGFFQLNRCFFAF